MIKTRPSSISFLNLQVKIAKSEVHFFDNDTNYLKGLDWYRDQMPAAKHGEIAIEKSPSYFVTDSVPERVLAMDPNILLLLVLRDPVVRLISDYTQILHNHLEKGLGFKPFEELVLNRNGSVNTRYDAVGKSVYVHYVKRWLAVFPQSQLHLVNGDKLIHKPWHELKKVEKFLGLPSEISEDYFYYNVTKGFHCVKRGKGGNRANRCLAKSKGRAHPKIDRKVISKLRRFYAPHNYEFYNVVGQDFGWPEE